MQVVKVLESHMAYTDRGNGDRAVVFLHGNPTSSYLWRNVIPQVADQARCLAPDLIGMGASGKPDIADRFADHARYLDAFLDALQWPREIPIDGEPADVRDRFIAYDQWLAATTDVPKLLLTTEPGSLVSPRIVRWCREHVAGLEVESVGPAGHHAPEDQPEAIGQAIARWLARHR